jgi:hypothetical protein
MRYLLFAMLLASCSVVHKTTDKHIKDSTASIVDQSKIYTVSDSLHTSKNNTIETADLVVVFKDTTTGFVSFKGDSISIPAASIKEIRHKQTKQKQSQETTQIIKDQAIINDKKNTVTVKEKTVTTEKKAFRLSWWWIIVIIASILLYISRKKIYAIYKAVTI